MYENEKIQKWIEEHENDYCEYCKYNDECGGGVRGGPNGLMYPLCVDKDIEDLLDIDLLLEDIES